MLKDIALVILDKIYIYLISLMSENIKILCLLLNITKREFFVFEVNEINILINLL